MSAKPKASPKPAASPSLSSKAPKTASSSSSSSSSSSASTSSAPPADTSNAVETGSTSGSSGTDGVLAAPVVNPHITFRNWLIASAVIAAFVVLLLVANASESIPESTVWLILFGALWGAMTVCCGMFKGAERCATYVREQEMAGGYMGTGGEVETSSTAAASTDSGSGEGKYQKL